MSVSRTPLHELYQVIKNEITEKLKEHELLSEVKEVIYGEQARIGNIQSPAIWIVPEPYQPQLRGGRTAQHDFTFNFVTLVKSVKPGDGLEEAQEMAMKVYDVLTEDRTLNNLVSDVRPLRIDPAYDAGKSLQLYWSAVQFGFRLQRRE